MMNPIDPICNFLESTKDKTKSEQNDKIETQPTQNEEPNPSYEPNPRDGMSLESAKFVIGRCANNSQYEIRCIENKGRYFTAQVMDSKGKQVNQLLVDKLNGRVRFLR